MSVNSFTVIMTGGPTVGFFTKESIIGSNPDPFKTILADPGYLRYPKYANKVDSAEKIMWIAEYPAVWLENIFSNLQVKYKRKRFSKYIVFSDFSKPEIEISAFPSESWKVVTPEDTNETGKAFDRCVWTVWTSKESQTDDMAFVLDMGQTEKISQVAFLAGGMHPRDNPSGYQVQVSKDGSNWSTVAQNKRFYRGGVYWDGKTIKADLSGLAISAFKQVSARYIKITLIGESRFCWSIAELFVYGPKADVNRNNSYNQLISKARDLKKERDWESSAAMLFRAILLDPDRYDAHIKLEEILQSRNKDPIKWFIDQSNKSDDEIALSYAQEAYRLCPGNINVAENLLKILERNGYKQKAQELLKMIKNNYVPEVPSFVDFGPVALQGYTIEAKVLEPGDSLEITYFWKVNKRPDINWVAFIHIYSNDKIIYDDHPLAENQKPVRMWIEGDVLVDKRRFKIPSDYLSGLYNIGIGLWDPETEKRLKIKKTSLPNEHNRAVITTINVKSVRDKTE